MSEVQVIFVLGIDAATWTVIRPNLDKLENFRISEEARSLFSKRSPYPLLSGVACSVARPSRSTDMIASP